MAFIPKGVTIPAKPAAIEPLKWLEGTWRCEDGGKGEYPTIKDFKYGEELRFHCVGQPMLNYRSFSWNFDKKTPLHQESGFLRINPGSSTVAFMVAHNFGVTTIEEGEINGTQLKLISNDITRLSNSTTVAVTKCIREFNLEDGQLKQTLWMETTDTPLTKHLEAVYNKVDE